jgi:uncharacterized protein DUF1501
MDDTRRKFLEQTLFGTGYLGLRALASGLPLFALQNPRQALGADATACADKTQARYLILSTSSAGDPLNANVPGTYDFSDIAHAADPRMARTEFMLGDTKVAAAQLWSTLPPWVLARTTFFHHATLTNNHPNLPKVLRLMGAANRQEMLPSIIAKYLAPCLGTVQAEPLSAGAGDILTYEGRGLPGVPPIALRDVLTRPQGPLADLQKLRDATIDQMYGLVKQQGTAAQRGFIDRLALSRKQARSLSDDLLTLLDGITSSESDGQILAAVALIKMNVAPVIAIRIDFGKDNHSDPDLMKAEVPQTEVGVQRIGMLMDLLEQHGLQDRVTFGAYNVFGRTLKKLGLAGRDHWGSHHTTVMIGPTIRGGVVGGLEPKSEDYYATGIDAASGRAAPGGGDIPFTETLAAMGKTLARAVGMPAAALEDQIHGGKVVTAALAG